MEKTEGRSEILGSVLTKIIKSPLVVKKNNKIQSVKLNF